MTSDGAGPRTSRFQLLSSPFASGRLSMRNRIVMLPHGTSMVRAGKPTEADLAYYSARAEGVGMVITGATVAHPEAVVRQRNRIEAFDPDVIPALRLRATAVKAHGAVIIGQLNHVGRESMGSESEFVPVSASAQRASADPYPPHALEDGEIAALVAGFAAAAANLQAAGYDGIELHAAHGYLLAQFLSPATNTRSDRWGGSPERRFRLVRDIVEAVRERCGGAFLIGVRLSADEEVSGGLGIRDTVAICGLLAAIGEVDYLSITIGTRGRYVKDATTPVAPAARAAAIIRKECPLPVIVGQKIQTPQLAEQLLSEGAADMIGMARAFVAEPRFAAKVLDGDGARIRPCVGLNQDCRSFSPHLYCAVNPETGRETVPECGPLAPTKERRRVAVVDGGPAGMECARVASARGHEATLFEASGVLGGQFLLAASLPGRSGLSRLIDHLIGELRILGARVELNAQIVDLDGLQGYDAVVVATGGLPVPPTLETAGQRTPSCKSWHDIVAEGAPAPFGDRLAVFADDGTGFWTSYGIVELLTEAGWRVTVATTAGAIGNNMPAESMPSLLERLGRGGTRFRVLSGLARCVDGGVVLANLASGMEEVLPCDLVVVQTGRRATPPIPAAGWESRRGDLHFIGDCVAPRRISHALFEAQRVGRML